MNLSLNFAISKKLNLSFQQLYKSLFKSIFPEICISIICKSVIMNTRRLLCLHATK